MENKQLTVTLSEEVSEFVRSTLMADGWYETPDIAVNEFILEQMPAPKIKFTMGVSALRITASYTGPDGVEHPITLPSPRQPKREQVEVNLVNPDEIDEATIETMLTPKNPESPIDKFLNMKFEADGDGTD